MRSRQSLPILLAVVLLSGAARAGEDPPPPPPDGTLKGALANNPIAAILRGPRLWTTVVDPKDWVKASRPAVPGDFMPVGITPEKQRPKLRTPAELATMEADMLATRTAVRKRGELKPASLAPAAQKGSHKKTKAAANP